MSRAGLGLGLHDLVYGSDFRTVFDAWWGYAKRNYFSIRDGEVTGSVTMYYDPLVPFHHPGDQVAIAKLLPAHGALPLKPEDTRALFKAAVEQLNWRSAEPLVVVETPFSVFEILYGMFLAREFEDVSVYAKLKAQSEAAHEPTLDEETGEFTWRFGLDEEHPRGQLNATAAMVEAAGQGAWSNILNKPNLRKFVEPTVYGVDFPNVCPSQAFYDVERRLLAVSIDAGAPNASGKPTTFRVTNVSPETCVVEVDGVRSDDWRIVDGDIEISTTIDKHTFVIRCA
ncbi:MAG: hypothetical protein ACE5JS_15275 [Nitrospinota bacterium]